MYLAEYLRFVRTEIDNAVANNARDGVVRDGQVFNFSETELHVGGIAFGGVLTGAKDHVGGHVDSDDLSLGADEVGGEEAVDSGAGSEVEDCFSFLDVAEADGVTAS